jgi:S1-C subfamily serine protease
MEVVPGSAAAVAGVQAGDLLLAVAGIPVEDVSFGQQFRDQFGARPPGTPYDIVVDRGRQQVTLRATLDLAEVTNVRLEVDTAAGAKARRIREGILTGTTGR